MSGENFKKVTGRILKSGQLRDFNSFDTPDKIKPQTFSGVSIKQNTLTLDLPPASVIVLALQ